MPRPMRIRVVSTLALVAGLVAVLAVPACVDVDPNRPLTSNVDDWRDEIIYQVMIDRFEDGDPNNNWNVDYGREAAYHGGDWQGLIDRLDYIEALGVTALWISPVVKNVEMDAGFHGYHGYWTQDFLSVNPHFGSLEKMQELVREAHARDIKVILDIVVNHVGQLFYYDINRNGQPDDVLFGGGGPGPGSRNQDIASDLRRATEWDPEFDSRGVQGFTSLGENGLAPLVWVNDPGINRVPPEPGEFHNDDWYNRRGRVTVWEAGGGEWEAVREQEVLGDFPGGLKDLKTTNPEVREALIRVFQYWIEVGDFDGFRIDTLKHVEREFFDEFAPAIRRFAKARGKDNFFMFGEAFDGNDALLGWYTHGQGVDSVFYFSAKYQVFDDIFGRSAPPSKAQELYEARWNLDDRGMLPEDDPALPRYAQNARVDGLTGADGQALLPTQTMVHFIDNHDVPRFLFDFPDVRRLRAALVYALTFDGIPCIYYGTEQDFDGGPDPSNREDMWHSGFETDGATFRHMQSLIRLRKALTPLRRGDVTWRWASPRNGAESDAGLMAFERAAGDERVLVVINSHAERAARSTFEGATMQTGFPGGTVLEDRLNGGETFTVSADGTLDLTTDPLTGRVLVPQ